MVQHIVHPTFFADKIRYREDTGSVIYKSRMHLGKKRNFEVLDAIEFLHRSVCTFPIPMSRSFAITAFTLTQPGGRERSVE